MPVQSTCTPARSTSSPGLTLTPAETLTLIRELARLWAGLADLDRRVSRLEVQVNGSHGENSAVTL